jgi:hypothetical protein
LFPKGRDGKFVANRRHLGSFSSQAHALQQAISWAQEDAKGGAAAQVFLETGTDEFKTVWSSIA